MNFKSIGFKAAVATAVVAGSALMTSSAQAATVGSVSFGGLGELTSVKGNEGTDIAKVVFTDGVLNINSGTGSFAGFVGGTATFFQKSFTTSLTNRSSFVTFRKVGFSDLTFYLDKFVNPSYTEFGGTKDDFGQFTSRVSGKFNPGGNAIDEVISAFATIRQNSTSNFTDITLSTTPIPTPALLPGLIGMGIAAIRKRKSEESEVEAAETAKA